MDGARHIFARHWKLVSAVLLTVVVFLLAFRLRGALFPFVLGGIIAYIALPLFNWIEARLPWEGRFVEPKRVVLVLAFLIVFFGLLFLLFFLIGRAVADSFSSLLSDPPRVFSSAGAGLGEWLQSLRGSLPPGWQAQVDKGLSDAGSQLGEAIAGTLSKSAAMVPASIGFIFGMAVLPFFLFYLLKDSKRLGRNFYSSLPSSFSPYARGITGIVDRVLGSYLRAQLALSLVVGIMVFAGLAVLGVPGAPMLAAIAALTEMVPIVGPWIGGAIGVLLTLALAPDKTLWVIGLYVIVQVLENTLLVPRIQSQYLHLHPVIIIVLIPLGAEIAGVWGIIFAVPLAAIAVRLYDYVRHQAMVEDTMHPPDGSASSSPAGE